MDLFTFMNSCIFKFCHKTGGKDVNKIYLNWYLNNYVCIYIHTQTQIVSQLIRKTIAYLRLQVNLWSFH